MPNTAKLNFSYSIPKCDPIKQPVLILGQMDHLKKLKYDEVKSCLEPSVTGEVFEKAISVLAHGHGTASLNMHYATIAKLPQECSRHNTPSRAHGITKLVKSHFASLASDKCIVITCESKDVYASGLAVTRAYPLFSKKSSQSKSACVNINVSFIVVSSCSAGKSEGAVNNDYLNMLEYGSYGLRLAARIIDTPTNEMNVDQFLDEVKAVGKELNITPTIIRGEELKQKGFGGIAGVGNASLCPPALAVLAYTPSGAEKNIAWVGKGIVYDSGGLNIKTGGGMVGMKKDCGGAAGILGAFYATVKADFTENLYAVFCLAENSIGPAATRPDDIHTMYSGLTVEIDNTDAEGRLVLADGVAYAKKDLKADIIVDMATLTGDQGVATGKNHAGIITNKEEWEDLCVTAGLTSGDLVHPLVFCPELHFVDYSSPVADMKNSTGALRNPGCSCGGLFMLAHLGFDFPGVYLHIDMALPVHVDGRATGYGVGLLSVLFGSYCKNPMLKEIAPTIN